MLKLLRKYNKLILVIGGSILMVIFLVPSTCQRMGGDPVSQVVAHMDGRSVTGRDWRLAGQELEAASKVTPEIISALGIEPRHVEHWLLLSHEAEQAGVSGGVRDGRGFLDDAARLTLDLQIMNETRRMPASQAAMYMEQVRQKRPKMLSDTTAGLEQRRAAAINLGVPEESVDLALARVRGMVRLMEASNTASVFSTREAVTFGQRVFDTATLGVIVIPGAKIAEGLPDPDESRLQAHFEKYKSIARESDTHGIGYLRPAAVQVEWLTIDRQAIEKRVTPDPIEVNKYWRQNKDKFPGEFAQVKENVEGGYRDSQVGKILERAGEVLKRELFRSTAGLPSEGKFKTLPPDWSAKMPALSALAGQIESELAKDFKIEGVRPTIASGAGIWRSEAELGSLPGLGQSALLLGDRGGVGFPQWAMQVRDLGGDERLGMQKGLVYGPLTDQQRNAYYFRIIDARRSGPPEALDEVRALVKADVKLLDGLEKLAAEAEAYKARAVTDGLPALVPIAGAPVDFSIEVTGQGVRRGSQGAADPRLNVPEFRDAVMDMARKIDPTRDILSIDADQRTLAMIVPAARGLVVAQVQRWRPMTVERFRRSASTIRGLANSEAASGNQLGSFGLDRLVARHAYKAVAGPGEKPEPDKGDGPKTEKSK